MKDNTRRASMNAAALLAQLQVIEWLYSYRPGTYRPLTRSVYDYCEACASPNERTGFGRVRVDRGAIYDLFAQLQVIFGVLHELNHPVCNLASCTALPLVCMWGLRVQSSRVGSATETLAANFQAHGWGLARVACSHPVLTLSYR